MGYLHWDVAIGQRVNDPRWFLVMASKTVAWFWTAPAEGRATDIYTMVENVEQNAPDIWSYTPHLLNTAISFTLAHEVAHIVLGHLEGSHAGKLRLRKDGPQSRVSAMDGVNEELEADAWAAEALFRLAGNDFKKQTLAMSVPALGLCLSAVKRAMTAPATNEIARATDKSHPPEMIRVRQVHSVARSHGNEVAGSPANYHFVRLGFWVAEQLVLFEREGMHWVPEWLRERGLA
jgi:hypothetical protein